MNSYKLVIKTNYVFTELLDTGYHTVFYNYTDTFGCANATSASFFLDECLGMHEEVGDHFSVIFYPNPVDESLTIKISDQTNYNSLILYTADGSVVEEYEINRNQNTIALVTNHLSTGVYLIKLLGSEKVSHIKFLKN